MFVIPNKVRDLVFPRRYEVLHFVRDDQPKQLLLSDEANQTNLNLYS